MEKIAKYGSEFEATELSLAQPGTNSHQRQTAKRPLADEFKLKSPSCDEDAPEATPNAKAQVVGWPPVRSFRKNNFQPTKKADVPNSEAPALFVKVSMDGAPYLRKIDLHMYKGYKELRHALDDMFNCFSIGSECAIAYEDKDGDWMLAGDVPWEMFISSCKRLRIMKGNDAKGLGSNP